MGDGRRSRRKLRGDPIVLGPLCDLVARVPELRVAMPEFRVWELTEPLALERKAQWLEQQAFEREMSEQRSEQPSARRAVAEALDRSAKGDALAWLELSH